MKITSTPLLQTYFFDDLDLGAPAGKTTAVFLPEKYTAQAAPNAIVYLPGFKAPVIDAYLASSTYALREEINKSGPTDLLFIAPTLGPVCEAGLLVTNGLDWYLDEVLKRLAGASSGTAVFTGAPALGKIYLAAHSGGGRPARALAMQITNGLAATPPVTPKYGVVEYWLFDALYAPVGYPATDKTGGANVKPLGDPDAVEEEWYEVIRTQNIKLTTVYATAEPKQRSLNLKSFMPFPFMDWLLISGSAVFTPSKIGDHPQVPRVNWRDVMDART
jgi:hypothetical protein